MVILLVLTGIRAAVITLDRLSYSTLHYIRMVMRVVALVLGLVPPGTSRQPKFPRSLSKWPLPAKQPSRRSRKRVAVTLSTSLAQRKSQSSYYSSGDS